VTSVLELYKRDGVCCVSLDQANQNGSRLQYPSVFYVPSLLAQPFWNRDLPHIIQLAQIYYSSIRIELVGVLERVEGEMGHILRDVAGPEQWKTIYLMQEGRWKSTITQSFPHTMELLRQLPIMQNGRVWVSVTVYFLCLCLLLLRFCGLTFACTAYLIIYKVQFVDTRD
jgi:hypothetical protein